MLYMNGQVHRFRSEEDKVPNEGLPVVVAAMDEKRNMVGNADGVLLKDTLWQVQACARKNLSIVMRWKVSRKDPISTAERENESEGEASKSQGDANFRCHQSSSA